MPVKPNISLIRYICFLDRLSSPWRVLSFLIICIASIPRIIFVAVSQDVQSSIFRIRFLINR
ncbi:hypothetical protein CW304_21765 [Bacillus sp. UFRGS-B20]|nr:hypothetical protein CW304_21765 [Bacillus sp. UFRGS-B20]